MAHRSIEETFQAIRPKGRKGIPDTPTIGVSIASSNGDLASSLSQAGQQIAQLQTAYQQQAALISANTQAIQNNTSAQANHSAAGKAADVASSFFGGGLGLISPLISGIASLFGGRSEPAPLPTYTPPAPIEINTTLHSAIRPVQPANSSAAEAVSNSGPARSDAAVSNIRSGAGSPNAEQASDIKQTPNSGSQRAGTTHVTVNINAMDSQSFMDRSNDIANAVREAMLNLHPINAVVAEL
jgi:hypothetical protein